MKEFGPDVNMGDIANLLHIGRTYGFTSKEYFDCLSKMDYREVQA